MRQGLIVDLFAGGGGASTGVEAALGRPVDIAINHSAVALEVHKANHPHTLHLTADIWSVDPKEVCGNRSVDLLWASPDCRHFSRAKSGVPRSKSVRSLADVVIRWLDAVRPEWVFMENVQEFTTWGDLYPDDHPDPKLRGCPDPAQSGKEFDRWRSKFIDLGYSFEMRVLDASHFGAPTKRKRLFMVARAGGGEISWPTPTHGPGLQPFRTAAECIDWSIPCPSIFDRKRPLAEKTMARIAEGIRRYVLNHPRPYVLELDQSAVAPTLVQTGYGERPGQTPRALDLQDPMGTLVAGGVKQGLVAAYMVKHFGGVFGHELDKTTSTITARDHNALAACTLAKFRGTSESHPGSADIEQPLPTVSAGGTHVAQVIAFLRAYYGSDGTSGQLALEPLRTITTKHRLGIVTVAGVDYQIVDIGMRMLEPHELLRAQFGRFADTYDLSAAKTKSDQVRLVGNSVCPEVAEALVRANFGRMASVAA